VSEEGRRLFFLRHGPADRDRFTGCDDAQRPLDDPGREQIRRESEVFARLDLALDAAITSPYARAAETAAIVAARLGLGDRLRADPRLRPGFALPALVDLLAATPREHRRLLLVGHEPDFSEMIGALTRGQVVMKKGALARVDLTAGSAPRGRLVWLLQPKVMLRGLGYATPTM